MLPVSSVTFGDMPSGFWIRGICGRGRVMKAERQLRPTGTWGIVTTNPQLKLRAILITSRWDA